MSEHQNSEVITKEKIDKAINLLKEQKPKEREDVSDREAIRKMRRYIEKLTSDKYGYSYDEVSEMLKGLGINLSGSRIKYLLGELKKSSRRRQRTEPSEDNSTSSSPVTENQQAVLASSETSESDEKGTKGKSKKQLKAAQKQSDKPEPQSQLYKDEDL
jgi:phage terminase small subunit